METIFYLISICVMIFAIIWFGKHLKPKQIIKQKVTNVNNQWISPNTPPFDDGYTPVLCTIQNMNGKRHVTDAIFDSDAKQFRSVTPDFHKKVIAWMTYPKPYNDDCKQKELDSIQMVGRIQRKSQTTPIEITEVNAEYWTMERIYQWLLDVRMLWSNEKKESLKQLEYLLTELQTALNNKNDSGKS